MPATTEVDKWRPSLLVGEGGVWWEERRMAANEWGGRARFLHAPLRPRRGAGK